MTGQQIAVVLHAVLTLDGGKRQVARLSGKAAEETVDGEQTDLHAVAAQVQYEAVEHGRRDRAHKAADAALDRLMRAQRRGELGLAQAAADENAPESLSHVMTNGSSRYGAFGSFRPRRTSDESIHGMTMPAVNTSARS